MAAAPSIENISKYLTLQSTTLTWSKFRQHCGSHLPYNVTTCLSIICYTIKLCSHSNHDLTNIITRLEDSASQFFDVEMMFMSGQVMENVVWEKDHEICQLFVKCFQPVIRELFTVPGREKLSDEDGKTRKKNERLAGFFDFLLQVLNSEDNEEVYVIVKKELRFVLTFLGDTPFWCTEFESVRNLLIEFENLGNEVGEFVYSCVLAKQQIREGVGDVLKRIEHLNSKVKQHCIDFVEFPEFDSLREGEGFDSRFIVDSLIGDIDNLMVRRFYSGVDCIEDNIKKLNEELTCRRTLLEESGEMQVMDANGIKESLVQVRNGVDSLLEDLENLRYRRYQFSNDHIQAHFRKLHVELMSCRTLLEDNGEMQVMDMEELRESRVQIRDGAYEAEYLINAQVVGNLPVWYLNLRLPVATQKISLARTKLQAIKKICFRNDGSEVGKGFSSDESLQVNDTSRRRVKNMIVGFEDKKIKILGDLIGGSRKLETISIFGMPGLGKTTIANELYRESVYDYFDKRVWCVVSQVYEKRKVLVDILTSLERKPDKNRYLNMEDESLGLAIYQSLKGRRYLVVLDDVWHSNTCNDVRRYLPDDRIGSRIMLTSRIKDTAPASSIFYTLPLLSEVQCWNLLVQKAVGEGPCSPQLLDIAQRIADKCCGLPLAVVVIAGVLANLEKEASVWKKVERNMDSYIRDDPSDYIRILHLSYEHLPDHLKLCFLYLGAFREDTEIPVRKLTYLLIAEGFIQKKDNRCLELVAYDYILELINRSLLMVASKSFDGRIKSCRMHDLLRDMCLRRANEENFLKPVCYPSIYEKHHRLYAHFTRPICSWSIFGLHCRSFSGYLPAPASRLPQMPLLRVLDLFPTAYSHDEAKSIDRHVHLRYLAIGGVPERMHKLINLEYLSIETEAKIRFPLSILKALSKLKHLHITRRIKFQVEHRDSSHETHLLQSLSYVQIYKHEDEDALRRLPHLRKLKCVCNGKLFPDLRFINELQSLNMTFKGYFSGELAHVILPQTLKKLHLQGTGLQWEKMSVIARLPNLEALKICYDAFVGEEWVTADGEFPELKLLKLEEVSLKKWITCSQHFPKLRNLVLKSCHDLFEIPGDLGEVPTLQVIEVNDSSRDACLSAIRIEKEQLEYGNEALKVKISLHPWSKDELMQQEFSSN